ncbi:hypothetical protein [Ferruginibacter albus]|uniref:hypothetical protein n=1 Tax=Ferruginibacter albus TaxID=2875540 RepID=UPI001CC56E2D|nr:hypothetical protein [Ferruginibacter albus]UAY51943.1 hypothetical protein K9M53_15295 [Ferruginibacter albus]
MIARSNNKTLVIIIVVLLLINIATMLFFILGKEEKGSIRGNIKAAIPEFLRTKMNFSAEQMKRFDSLSQSQSTQFKATLEEMRQDKKEEFRQMGSGNFNDSVMNAMVAHSLTKHKILELRFFQYIKDIRALCTPEQMPKFDTSFYKIMCQKP